MTEADRYTESCLLCGSPLDYLETSADVTCSLCGATGRGNVRCPEGHYVCEVCHGAGFLARLPGLLDLMTAEGETSPFHMAERLMDQPDLPMLGCEHAHIAAGALMRALRSAGVAGVTEAHEREVLERTARQAVSAYCGLTGVCGVVPALGACYSVLVGGQCGRGPQTRATMELVSRLAAATAAEAEPGCCKAYVRTGMRETVRTMEVDLGIVLPSPTPVACTHPARHPHGCRGAECEWHPDSARTSTGTASAQAEPAAAEVQPAATATDHPRIPEETAMPTTGPAAQARYDDFFSLAYADGALDARTKILVALGASLAAGCSP